MGNLTLTAVTKSFGLTDVIKGVDLAVQDGEFLIPQVDRKFLWGEQARAEVDFAGDEKPGSVVVDTFARKLYFVMEGHRAMRYAIAVGREGIR